MTERLAEQLAVVKQELAHVTQQLFHAEATGLSKFEQEPRVPASSYMRVL